MADTHWIVDLGNVPEWLASIGTGDMADSVGPRLAVLGYHVTYASRDPCP